MDIWRNHIYIYIYIHMIYTYMSEGEAVMRIPIDSLSMWMIIPMHCLRLGMRSKDSHSLLEGSDEDPD